MRFSWLLLFLALAFPLAATAQEDANATHGDLYLDEIVVSARGIQTPLHDTPRNVTIITREDIERSGSTSVTELIARQTGVTLQSYYGTDSKALVDIRGQGSVAAQNVLVLVDGQRITPVDMAAGDLNMVSLSEVERIEIVRGPGGVVHGDRAVGGVINVITRDGSDAEGVEGSLTTGFGSYGASLYSATVRWHEEDVYGCLVASSEDTTGYRNNGALWKTDYQASIGWEASQALTLSLMAAYHEDRYGLPGGVNRDDFYSRDLRRGTGTPTGYGETTDFRIQGRAQLDLDAWGALDLYLGFRTRENPYDFGWGRNRINDDTVNFDLTYVLDFEIGGLRNELLLGADTFTSYYRAGAVAGNRDRLHAWSGGAFIHDTLWLTDALAVNLGYRYNSFESSERDNYDTSFENDAYEAGLLYNFTERTSVYATVGTSFRTPAVDEMTFQDGDLEPQTGSNYEIGARIALLDNLDGSVALYHSVTSNEIWFDPVAFVNNNYEHDVVRDGLELTLRYDPLESLSLWGNYSHINAVFDELDTTMPLVPKDAVTLGADWNILPELLLNVTGTHVGAKQVDTLNTVDRLWDYSVVDTKLTWTIDDFQIYAGVNNLLDSCYATMSFGDASYYPMPTRNGYAGVKWSF